MKILPPFFCSKKNLHFVIGFAYYRPDKEAWTSGWK